MNDMTRRRIRFSDIGGKSVLVWLLLLLWSLGGSHAFANETSAKVSPVVMFSATYCPSCLYAKKFFEANSINYKEYDIETSPAAREYFDKLGGRGTPLLFVNNQRMEGFSEPRFWQYYSTHSNQR